MLSIRTATYEDYMKATTAYGIITAYNEEKKLIFDSEVVYCTYDACIRNGKYVLTKNKKTILTAENRDDFIIKTLKTWKDGDYKIEDVYRTEAVKKYFLKQIAPNTAYWTFMKDMYKAFEKFGFDAEKTRKYLIQQINLIWNNGQVLLKLYNGKTWEWYTFLLKPSDARYLARMIERHTMLFPTVEKVRGEQPDIIITHDCPASIIDWETHGHCTSVSRTLEHIADIVVAKKIPVNKWFFGHLHIQWNGWIARSATSVYSMRCRRSRRTRGRQIEEKGVNKGRIAISCLLEIEYSPFKIVIVVVFRLLWHRNNFFLCDIFYFFVCRNHNLVETHLHILDIRLFSYVGHDVVRMVVIMYGNRNVLNKFNNFRHLFLY